MNPSARRVFAGQAARFLVAGGINTGATLLVYWLLLSPLGYVAAYTTAFIAGICISYVLNVWFVFRTRASRRNAIGVPVVYGIQYAVGLGVLALWTSVLHLPPSLGALASIAVTVPVTFMLLRTLLAARPDP